MSSSYGMCSECHKFGWLPHNCARWEWRTDETHTRDDDWSEVRARDDEEAAEMAAEQWDQEDYYLIRTGNCTTIQVRDTNSQEVTFWSVHAESIPTYYAKRLVEADKE